MQRFYQAVELDEAEMARKRSQSVEPNAGKKLKSLEQTLQRKEYSSLSALEMVNFIYFGLLSKTPSKFRLVHSWLNVAFLILCKWLFYLSWLFEYV